MKSKLLFSILVMGFGALNAQSIDDYVSGTITYKTIGTSTQNIVNPVDLDFKPTTAGELTFELWVLNKRTGSSASITRFDNAGKTNQTAEHRVDAAAGHFMNYGIGIAMGAMSSVPNATANILFGVACEGTNGGDNFMGPTLWPTDLGVFAKVNTTGLGSHCDMLHQNPKSAGIAHEADNIYWVTDGNKKDIVKNDFKSPHGYGADNHSNGQIYRYTGKSFGYVPGIPSHLVMDKESKWLYIADTGNKKIIRLLTTSATGSVTLTASNEPLALYKSMTGAKWEDYITTGLSSPSGIDLMDGRLVVTDNANGDIIIYDITGTTPVEKRRFKSASGNSGIMGVKFGPDKRIWYVDYTTDQVVKVEVTSNPNGVNEYADDTRFNLYPSLANSNDKINIDFELAETQNVKINVSDLQGRVVDVISSKNNTGTNHVELDASKYSSGVYIVKLSVGEKNYFKKLVIN